MSNQLPMQDRLSSQELQELTLLVGSRKGLLTYLGMERKAFDLMWTQKGLLAPTEYVRSLPQATIVSTLTRLGSFAKVAEHYGVSESFLKGQLSLTTLSPLPSRMCAENLEKYGSVRLMARCTGFSEGEVRKFVKANKLEHLLRYDFSNHNNAKGRRAETFWASLHGDKILEDCNVTQGSQADYDYVHSVLGKVNVKSSKAHRYTAQTRKDNPWYWKFSTRSLEKADTVALVLYDSKMQNPLHSYDLKVTPEMLTSTSMRCQIVRGKLLMIYKAEEVV